MIKWPNEIVGNLWGGGCDPHSSNECSWCMRKLILLGRENFMLLDSHGGLIIPLTSPFGVWPKCGLGLTLDVIDNLETMFWKTIER